MMRYEITAVTITFFLDNPKKEQPFLVTRNCAGTRLTRENLVRICDALVRQLQGNRPTTQRTNLRVFLRAILSYFQTSGAEWPTTSDESQLFLLSFFQFFLTDMKWSRASATTRMSHWSTIIYGLFEFCVAEEILPCDVIIPSSRMKKVQSDATSQHLLGETTAVPEPVSAPPKKTLVNIEFGSLGGDYLERIEKECLDKINLIKQVCFAHWKALMSDGETGERFSNQISPSQIASVIESGEYAQQIGGGSPRPLASTGHPQGHLWALSLSKLFMENGNHNGCVSVDAHQNNRFFKKNSFFLEGYDALECHTKMPLEAFKQLTWHSQYCRFARILSSLDAAVACCLLTIEHPQFTSESLQNARLLNSRGKSYLLLTDNDDASILSVDKPRAGRRKAAVLTPVAQKLLADILIWTAPVRTVLKKAGDKSWRYLFLGYGKGGTLGPLAPAPRYLNGKQTNSLVSLYPVLADYGLGSGTFDYRRIRTTMGVLRWFETGSILEMSRRLGNSKRVVLQHYLPAPLLHAWNTRIIRRFQNTLIALAAYDEDYLLEVTDFTSISDLQHFIAQLALEYRGSSSPLAKQVQSRFGSTALNDDECHADNTEGILNVRLSEKSLAYLYAFSDFAASTLTREALNQVDAQTKLAPIQFVDLARLIRHACENDEVTSDLREILDLPRLRQIHVRATAQQTTLSAHFTKLSVVKQWESQDV